MTTDRTFGLAAPEIERIRLAMIEKPELLDHIQRVGRPLYIARH